MNTPNEEKTVLHLFTEIAIVEQEYLTSEAPSVVGTHSFASYGATLEPLRAGRRVVVEDAETAPDIRAGDRPAYQALSLRAFLNTPLLKAGKLVYDTRGIWLDQPRAGESASVAGLRLAS